MKIVQIGTFPLNTQVICGGVEASILGIAKQLSLRNHVTVIDIPRQGIDDNCTVLDSLRVFRFTNPGKHQKDAIKRIPSIIKIIQQQKPSICHIHGTNVFCNQLQKALLDCQIPTIVTVHGLIFEEKRKALKRRFSAKLLYQFIQQTHSERSLLERSPSIIVDTEYVSKQIKSYRLNHCPDISIIPQGIREDAFNRNCSKTSKEILSVGAISPRKGHMYLIKAFELTANYHPDAHLTICGNLADKHYYHDLLALISTLSCKEKITVRTDVTNSDLDHLFEKAHIFALHSQEESQGIALVEAMAAGLPIVATNIGGIPYVVKDQQTGLLSDFGNIQSFSSNLNLLLASIPKWEYMSKNGRDHATLYSWKHIAQSVENLYNHSLQRD